MYTHNYIIYIYTHTYTNISLSLYIYIYICMYIATTTIGLPATHVCCQQLPSYLPDRAFGNALWPE